jgi:hypothetical protein
MNSAEFLKEGSPTSRAQLARAIRHAIGFERYDFSRSYNTRNGSRVIMYSANEKSKKQVERELKKLGITDIEVEMDYAQISGSGSTGLQRVVRITIPRTSPFSK